ncbi:hypothetical protein WG628_05020 [Stenotrophomonas maltophilia]|nr:hypothetical protein [Stenotrophomonas maltophilia]
MTAMPSKNRRRVMGTGYVVVLNAGETIPERNSLVHQAWGDVPFSYFQGHESMAESEFLDLKVNKWEINAEWSRNPDGEPWIRIEIVREARVAEWLATHGLAQMAGMGGVLLIVEMDEGGGELDEVLLARLVSVFSPGNRALLWCNGLHEIDGEYISRLPSREDVLERLRRC